MRAHRSRIIALAIIVAILISSISAGVVSAVPSYGGGGSIAAWGDVLFNGDFEEGFLPNGACGGGMVGKGWGCFTNGGAAVFGFYDDMWTPVVYSGSHSQLIEINTKQIGGDNNRNAGIFQRVNVWPGYSYELSLKGMIRADDGGEGDPWRYRVYVGFDYHGGANWASVTDWRELPWDTYYDRLNPGSFSSYSARIVPTTPELTVFIRVERRWGTWYQETDFNLDAISLYGPVDVKPQPKPLPLQPEQPAYQPPAAVVPPAYEPPAPVVPPAYPPAPEIVCGGPNLLWNGNFEYGFQPDGVANYWTSFNNGGNVNYGYYDEMWPPVISEGNHGQLIEINTLDVGDTTQPNRISGIYQKVWLEPGATYELSLDAMMRERNDHSDEDFYRYMVQWGYSKHGGVNPAGMDFWERIPLDNIYLRTAPGDMQHYSTRFVAPSETTTIWLFAQKKWATLERELDVNLDNVILRKCSSGPIPGPVAVLDIEKYVSVDNKATWHDADYAPGPQTWVGDHVYFKFVVKNYGTVTFDHITLTDDSQTLYGCPVKDPLHPGETFTCVTGPLVASYGQHKNKGVVSGYYHGKYYSDADYAHFYATQMVKPDPGKCGEPGDVWHVVQPGDTLSALARAFNTSVEAILRKNNIGNANWIYVGQVLCIPDPPGGTGYVPPAQQLAAPPSPAPVASASEVAAPSVESSPVPAQPAAAQNSYRVQRGDTLSGIAARFNTTVEALMQLNGLQDANWIYAGQTLQLP